MDQPADRNWIVSEIPIGVEMQFRPARSSAVFLLPFIVGAASLLVSTYILIAIAGDWSRGDILIGGVAAALLCAAGLFFGWHCFKRAFRRERYVLASGSAILESCTLFAKSALTLEKERIKEVLQLYTPPEQSGNEGIWRTCIVYSSPESGKLKERVLEGDSEEVSAWLAAAFSSWAGVASRKEDTRS